MKRIPVNLMEKQHSALKKRAEEEGTTISDLIRRAINRCLAEKCEKCSFREPCSKEQKPH